MITKKRTQKLKQYSVQFCDKVRADFPQIPFTLKNPRIKCFKEQGVTSDDKLQGIAEQTNKGLYLIDGEYIKEAGEIIIYNIIKEKPAELKTTVRHECLHFLLYESGLPDADETNEFLALALYYNARPYGLLKRLDLFDE